MIGIINYDSGNTRSVQNVLERMGVEYVLSDKQEVLDNCTKIIFPGVGSAGSTMQSLSKKGLVDWIRNCEKPFLGICLGMQLLFDFSEEAETKCFGIIAGEIRKFKPTKKVPHMGWNLCEESYYYFVHSYFAPVNKYTTATCQYQDETFSAIVRKDNFWGMQFHPEKSGDDGQKLLSEFINNG